MPSHRHPIGANTWIWVSPLTDERLAELAPRVSAWGFDTIELPIEQPGDWDPARAADLLAGLGLAATTCLVMPGDRSLATADRAMTRRTDDYLRGCVDAAVTVGARTVAGPAYAPVGWCPRLDPGERRVAIARAADALREVAAHAGERGVTIGVEPLNRYETSLVNTVDQAMELITLVDSPALGVALDTFHMNVEERDLPAAVRAATGHVAHVQVCANDRGAPGADHIDWPGILDALGDAGYDGPLCIESFTGENATIATAASIWRPLAPSQDRLATDGLAFLRGLLATQQALPLG